jgi:hypothetical protein
MFPMSAHFFHFRWLENASCAQRAIDIWPKICQYVKKVKAQKKAAQPTCQSFITVRDAVDNDKFVLARLHTFISIAKQIEPFLTLYQTDRPMIMFLADDMKQILKVLMKRFLKPESLKLCSHCSHKTV